MKRTPSRNSTLLSNLQNIDWTNVILDSNTQLAYDNFYGIAVQLLNVHYPLSTVTVTSRDPPFVTPIIKSLLRDKNKLMRKGQLEQANNLAARISTMITQTNAVQLTDASSRGGAKAMWAKVNEVTGRQRRATEDSLDPVILNSHYAAISNNP